MSKVWRLCMTSSQLTAGWTDFDVVFWWKGISLQWLLDMFILESLLPFVTHKGWKQNKVGGLTTFLSWLDYSCTFSWMVKYHTVNLPTYTHFSSVFRDCLFRIAKYPVPFLPDCFFPEGYYQNSFFPDLNWHSVNGASVTQRSYFCLTYMFRWWFNLKIKMIWRKEATEQNILRKTT